MKLRPAMAHRKTPAVPTVFGVGAWAASAAGSAAINAPANDALGDILLLCVLADENDTLGGIGDYAHVTGSPFTVNASNARLHILWKRATDGSNDLAALTATDGWKGFIIALRGVNGTGNPWSQIGSTSGSGTSVSVDGLTLAENNTLMIIVVGHEGDPGAQASNAANASLANVTEQADNSDSNTPDGGVVIISGTKATEGASGSTTLTLASAVAWVGVALAFNGAL